MNDDFYLYFYVSNSHVLWKKHTEEIIALLFTYLYYLQIFTLWILVYTTARGMPLMQSVTKYLARDIFLEDIDNGFLWLFRIPLRLYICIDYFIFHLSIH